MLLLIMNDNDHIFLKIKLISNFDLNLKMRKLAKMSFVEMFLLVLTYKIFN